MRPWIRGMVNEDSIDHWAGSGAVFVSVCLCVSPIPRAQGSIQVMVKVSRMAIGSLHLARVKRLGLRSSINMGPSKGKRWCLPKET